MSRTGKTAWIQGIGAGLAVLLLVYAGVALESKPRGASGHPHCTAYSADQGDIWRCIVGFGPRA